MSERQGAKMGYRRSLWTGATWATPGQTASGMNGMELGRPPEDEPFNEALWEHQNQPALDRRQSRLQRNLAALQEQSTASERAYQDRRETLTSQRDLASALAKLNAEGDIESRASAAQRGWQGGQNAAERAQQSGLLDQNQQFEAGAGRRRALSLKELLEMLQDEGYPQRTGDLKDDTMTNSFVQGLA
jgi:hypothetical protein